MTQHLLSKRLWRVAATALLLAAPGTGLAQAGSGGTGGASGSGSTATGNIGAQILSIGGVSQDDNRVIWISRDACMDDAEIVFRVDRFPSNRQLDVYVGESCHTMASRDGEGTDCQLILRGQDLPGTDDQRVMLQAGKLVNTALATDDCGQQRSMPDLWFLAVSTPGGTEELGADYYSKLTLNIDTDPPDAPTNIRGGRGENAIPVSWSVGNNTVDSFEIYVDPGNGGGVTDASTPPPPSDDDGGVEPNTQAGVTNTMCGTGALRSGAAADSIASLLAKSEGSPTATSTTLSASSIRGTAAAVGVIALDEAGNRSPLSEIACVYVVPTTGFKDLYEQQDGEIPQGCPCAAAGPAQLEGALPIALALGLIAYRRRRRS